MKTCRGCIHRFETSECVECVVTGLDHKNFESLEDVKRKAKEEAYDRPIGDWRRKPYYVCYCYELKEQK